MPSRKPFLISPGAWLALASLTACVDSPEENKADQPPPVVGSRQKPATAAGRQADSTSASGAGMRVMTATEADGGASRRQAGDEDMDAGPASAGSGDVAAAGRGGNSGRPAAGSGGSAGAGGMRAAGAGGRGGEGGQAGGLSDACSGQLCFTAFDCWLLSETDCSYSDCDNFICK